MTLTPTKRLLLGFGGGTPEIHVTDRDSYTDDGTLYDLLATSDKLSIAGIGGEVAFYAFHLGILHENRVTVRVTPIVDGTALSSTDFLLLRPTARELRLLKVPIRKTLPSTIPGYATGPRFSPRGAWAQCKVETVHVAEVLASLTTALTGANNDLVFTAVAGQGQTANGISVRYVNPGAPSISLDVSVIGLAITVRLATNGSSVITTTAAQITAAIAADPDASFLVTSANAPANSGAGVVTALSATPLAGGSDGPGYIAVEGCEVEHRVVRQSTVTGSNK